MLLFYNVLAVLGAYLLGSIPTSFWVGKLFYQIDIREHGSGNAGATNTFRVMGVKAGVPVLLIDAAKGWSAVMLVSFLGHFNAGSNAYIGFQVLLGIAAVLGHILPVFAQFRGGKGVATLLGMVIAIHPYSALMSMGIFVTILLISRYVSLSSIISGVSFPVLLVGYYHITAAPLVIFSILAAVALIITHRKNIERLLRKEESKANIFPRHRR